MANRDVTRELRNLVRTLRGQYFAFCDDRCSNALDEGTGRLCEEAVRLLQEQSELSYDEIYSVLVSVLMRLSDVLKRCEDGLDWIEDPLAYVLVAFRKGVRGECRRRRSRVRLIKKAVSVGCLRVSESERCPHSIECDPETTKLLCSVMGEMTKQEQTVLTLHARGWTQTEVAEHLDVSQATVSRHHQKAIRQLKQAFDMATRQ